MKKINLELSINSENDYQVDISRLLEEESIDINFTNNNISAHINLVDNNNNLKQISTSNAKSKKTSEKNKLSANDTKTTIEKANNNRTLNKPENKKDNPHFHGHRERLRNRIYKSEIDTIPDYEMLEMILFDAIPRKDVKEIAKGLIKSFGSLNEVLSIDATLLSKFPQVTKKVADKIKFYHKVSVYLAKEKIINRPILSNWSQILDFLERTTAFEQIEHFRLLFLNAKLTLIGEEKISQGTIDQTPVFPREIVKKCIEYNASAFIMVHNHPSGKSNPSSADIYITREINELAKKFNIHLIDHVILTKSGNHFSFSATELL